ncbi:hypothetical protein [Plantactinospora sonchi]|uniref:Uncharacterized protein n=1 Tax=Plantactinospora sonchi TaxID=1544735 RepID=A0ABU7RVH2_9ACTN
MSKRREPASPAALRAARHPDTAVVALRTGSDSQLGPIAHDNAERSEVVS